MQVLIHTVCKVNNNMTIFIWPTSKAQKVKKNKRNVIEKAMVGTLNALLNGRHVQVVHSFNEEESVGHDHSTDWMQYHHKGMSPHQYGHFVPILLMKTKYVAILKLVANLLFAAGHDIITINRDQKLNLVKAYLDKLIFESIIVTCDCTSSKRSLKDALPFSFFSPLTLIFQYLQLYFC